jgi:hypothetical protein
MIKLTLHRSSSWSASLFPLCSSSSSDMQRCWLSDGVLLTEGEGDGCPRSMTYYYLIGRRDVPWPYGWEDRSYFWIWPGQCNLAAFLFQRKFRKLIAFFGLGPASDAVGRCPWAGWGGGEVLPENAGQGGGDPTRCHFVLFPIFKGMIIFLFSLKSYDFWSVLMADLLCIFLPLVDIFCPLRHSPLGCGVAQIVVRRLAARQVRVSIPVSRHGMAPQGGPLLSGEQWGNKSVPYSRRMDVWMNVL